jgi:hypothetical protein
MKRFAAAVIAAAFCACAWAQQKPAPAPEKPEAKAEAAKPQKVSGDKKSRRHEDARQCLAKSSNNEIIKCAEAYL